MAFLLISYLWSQFKDKKKYLHLVFIKKQQSTFIFIFFLYLTNFVPPCPCNYFQNARANVKLIHLLLQKVYKRSDITESEANKFLKTESTCPEIRTSAKLLYLSENAKILSYDLFTTNKNFL